MASKPAVTLTFAGDPDKLVKSMKQVSDSAQQMGVSVTKTGDDVASKSEHSSKRMSNAWSTAAGVMLANFSTKALSAATGFISGMVSEAREAEKISRSTAQGIATMGAASWITAKQVGDLAEAISNKTGIDDEAIQQSANLLLTFGNVKNAAGAMNNVFDRSVLAAQDLAAKGFGDADSAAKMLGKALNDPIKGITALAKAGVTFTEGQKDQIKKMVEHGDLLGAQKLLLAEVEKQVGGTAEATATAGDKMRTTWANFQEDLGTAVLPLLDNLLGKLSGVVQWAGEHPQIVAAVAAITAGIWLLNFALNANPIVLVATALAVLGVALAALWTKSEGFRLAVTLMWTNIRDSVGGAVTWIIDRWNGMLDWFQKLPGRIGAALGTLASVISNAFKGAVNAAVDGLNWFLDHTLNYLINKSNQITGIVGGGSIPQIPHIPRMHTGGVVPGDPGTERLILARAGERVSTGAGGDRGGVIEVRSRGGSAADLIAALFADGQVEASFR